MSDIVSHSFEQKGTEGGEFHIVHIALDGVAIRSKYRIKQVGGQDGWKIFGPTIIEIAAPPVRFQVLQGPSRVAYTYLAPVFGAFEEIERVEVYVVENMQKMWLRGYRNTLRASLKKRADPLVSVVEVSCISNIEFS